MADRRLGGIGLIVLCFFGSAALRLSDHGWALAEGIGAAASGDTPAPPAQGDALLSAIKTREAQLDDEEKRLADRKQSLNVAEQKLQEQLAAFAKAQENLEKTLASADRAAEKDIARMTTVYEAMKPAEAAKIFEKMDVSFAAGLLARMKPDSAASVLAGMTPESAYAVTLTITSRNHGVPVE